MPIEAVILKELLPCGSENVPEFVAVPPSARCADRGVVGRQSLGGCVLDDRRLDNYRDGWIAAHIRGGDDDEVVDGMLCVRGVLIEDDVTPALSCWRSFAGLPGLSATPLLSASTKTWTRLPAGAKPRMG